MPVPLFPPVAGVHILGPFPGGEVVASTAVESNKEADGGLGRRAMKNQLSKREKILFACACAFQQSCKKKQNNNCLMKGKKKNFFFVRKGGVKIVEELDFFFFFSNRAQKDCIVFL